MEKSLFPQWVEKNLSAIALKIVETLNGSKNPLTYLHKTMLRKNYSTTLQWGSISSNGTVVRADIVAMDSSLPLKRRDSINKATGDIPKLGMKMYLNEHIMNELRLLTNTSGNEKQILIKLFGDVNKCISGVYETLEFMFLEALSTGITVITGEDSTGLGVRIDFGLPDSNKYGVSLPWTDPNATPIDDINNVKSKARLKGDSLQYMFMDLNTWNLFKANSQVKQEYAFYLGFVGSAIPNVPSLEKANEFLRANYNIEITIIDRQMLVEQNGKRSVTNPWAANIVTFLTNLNVGTLTYGTLAEESFPVKDVDYQKVDDFMLTSMYGKNDPVRQFTSVQALVLPVLDNVDSIYLMDTADADTSTQVEGDANFTYKSTNYTKASAIAGLNAASPGQPLTVSSTDAQIQKAINKLSDAQIEIFEQNLVPAA